MPLVAQRNLKTNSNDSVNSNNWTDTSITYSAIWPFNWAATYNASGDYVTVPNNAAFNITTGSVLMWVNTTLSWNYAYLMSKNNNVPAHDNFFLAVWTISNNGKPAFYNWTRRGANTAITDGKRHLVAVGAAPWTSDFWLDWKLDATVAYNLFQVTGANASLYIGRRAFDDKNLSGSISRARFYSHKLVASEFKNEFAFGKWFYSN